MKKFLSDSALDWKVNVNRNTFDKSKKHFASYNFGKLYPMYVQHCQANETLKIRPSMAFDLEPMTHELYNDVKCNTAWFKVNTRSLWSDYRKFARLDPTKNSPSIVHPYISRNDNFCTVGSLANHLGIPVATYGTYQGNTNASFITSELDALYRSPNYNPGGFVGSSIMTGGLNPFVSRDFYDMSIINYPSGNPCFKCFGFPAVSGPNSTFVSSYPRPGTHTLNDYINLNSVSNTVPAICISSGLSTLVADNFVISLPLIATSNSFLKSLCISLWAGSSLADATYVSNCSISQSVDSSLSDNSFIFANRQSLNISLSSSSSITSYFYDVICKTNSSFVSQVKQAQQTNSFVTLVISVEGLTTSQLNSHQPGFPSCRFYSGEIYSVTVNDTTTYGIQAGWFGYPRYSSVSEINTVQDSPFVGSTPSLPLNALPFRAYRNIYNSHFRDKIHDPFRDGNGDIYVDQYVENLSSGADSTTPIDFEYCRFEPDLFNTCLPTPTMGDNVSRPLVGITVGSDPSQATLNYNVNGEGYSIDVNTHTEGSQTVVDGIAAVHSADNDNLTVLTLKDAIQYGISLQDIENVRALTKWYEASYRGKGRFSYDSFIEAHFGKQPNLRENLAAEYLGGDTVYINAMKVVNQTSSSTSQPLGTTGGMANFQSKNDAISVFCDEDCYIMGIVWFTVDNINSQSIDPMWYLSQPSDYGSPEFADLGCQAIYNKVLAPLQCPSTDYNKVFGYQRMYGDKIYSFDTVAGDFLTLKSDYLMQRRFDSMPTLTASLSKMHPEDFTNIFCFDTNYDKIYGRWYFDVTISTWLQQTPNAQII